MPDDLQLTISGEEVPHAQVVQEGKKPKHRSLSLEHANIVGSVIADCDLNDEARRDLAMRLFGAMAPMNRRLTLEEFLGWCGLS